MYEKDLNLYLYLPPNSAHSKGVGTGLVFGRVLHYYRLSTYKIDTDAKIKEFHQRLLARGHTNDKLLPLFKRAEDNAVNYMARSEEDHITRCASIQAEADSVVRLHLTYHPDDPPTSDIQQFWRDNVARPAGDTPLPKCVNMDGDEVCFEKLAVAYHWPTNSSNLFSVRTFMVGEERSRHTWPSRDLLPLFIFGAWSAPSSKNKKPISFFFFLFISNKRHLFIVIVVLETTNDIAPVPT